MKSYREMILREVSEVLGRVDDKATGAFVREVLRAKRIYICGVGRSGLVVKAFGQRLMHLGYQVHLADEITAPGISRGDILLVCSGTGRTQITHYMARKARKIGARVIAITAAHRSALTKYAKLVIRIPAPISRGNGGRNSRQPGRSVFEQALFIYLDSVILTLMHQLKISGRRIERRHANLE